MNDFSTRKTSAIDKGPLLTNFSQAPEPSPMRICILFKIQFYQEPGYVCLASHQNPPSSISDHSRHLIGFLILHHPSDDVRLSWPVFSKNFLRLV